MTKSGQSGFSVVEVLVSAAILMIGVVGIVQVIPYAINSNMISRFESTSVVVAQRELDQMMNQPVSATSFTDSDSNTINLGDAASPGTIVGCPVVLLQGRAQHNFSATCSTTGYFVTRGDPDDPVRPTYNIRWAVVTHVAGTTVVSKRFIVGVWKAGARQHVPPITIEATVQKY